MAKRAVQMTKNSKSLSAITRFSAGTLNIVLAGIPIGTHQMP